MHFINYRLYKLVFGLFFMAVCAGCATTRVTTTEPGSLASATALFPVVDVSIQPATLGESVRKIGENVGGGLVSVYGIDDRPTGAMNFQGTSYEKMVRDLANAADCKFQVRPFYYFLYPPGYEILLEYDLSTALPEMYGEMTTTLALGRDTRLFNAFAMLSDSLGITVIADNAVADAVTGEITLENAPVYAVIEALLQSALIAPQDTMVDANDEYIFIYARGNMHPESLLLNADQLTAEQRAFLDRRINLTLPRPHGDDEVIPFYMEAFPLHTLLDSLSTQLGIPVSIEKDMQGLPVNYVVMNNVRVETAINLIIRQWLVPRFSFEVHQDRLHLRFR